jgi:hypothetical protein
VSGARPASCVSAASAAIPGRAPCEERETCADERPVVPIERRDVGDRAEGDEVEPVAQIERDAELGATPAQSVSASPTDASPLYGIAAVGAVRVQEREDGERLVGDAVVVDDDDVDAALARKLEALVVARAAVARDEERRLPSRGCAPSPRARRRSPRRSGRRGR